MIVKRSSRAAPRKSGLRPFAGFDASGSSHASGNGQIVLADLNGDKKLDFATANFTADTIGVVLQN